VRSKGLLRALRTSILAGLACVTPAVAPATPEHKESRDWPRWRGPSGDGRWTPESLPDDWAKREPALLWKRPVGPGYGGVTAGGSRIYVMDRQKEPVEMERLLCVSAEDGATLWELRWEVAYGKMDYGTGPRSSATIHDGRVYALGATGVAVCADALSGAQVWKVDTVADLGAKIPTWGFAASPVVDGERVLLHVGAGPGGALVALNRLTGAEVWRGGADGAGYCTPEIFTHAESRQLILWGPEHIQSLDPVSGVTNWKYPYKITYGVSIAQPLYHGGVLLVSGYWHGTKALKLGGSAREVSLLWENEKEICGLMSAPLFKDGVVYLLDKNRGLQALELQTGRILWSDGNTLSPADRNPQMSLVWMAERQNLAALLNSMGELVFVSLTPEGRKEHRRHQLLGKTWAHPAFSGNNVFARSDAELVAWRLW
jgi:outer membrane protein assembly factor BamB